MPRSGLGILAPNLLTVHTRSWFQYGWGDKWSLSEMEVFSGNLLNLYLRLFTFRNLQWISYNSTSEETNLFMSNYPIKITGCKYEK